MQLEAGLRFFDIRVRWSRLLFPGNSEGVVLCHTNVVMDNSLEHLMHTFRSYNFLEFETIFFSIKVMMPTLPRLTRPTFAYLKTKHSS